MSAGTLKEAARALEDEIEHDMGWLGKVIGGVVGFVVAVAIVVTFPLSAAVVAGALAAGSLGLFLGDWIGGWIGKFFHSASKDIVSGSPNTTIGGRQWPAARAKDPVKCHQGQKISHGSRTVTINLELAARVDDETQCKGKLKTGCQSVMIGGASTQVLEQKDPKLPAWYRAFTVIVDTAAFFTGIGALRTSGIAAFRLLRQGVTAGRLLHGAATAWKVADGVLFLPRAWVEGKFGDVYEGFGGGEPPSWLAEQEYITNTAGYRSFDLAWSTVGLGVTGRDAYRSYRTRPTSTRTVQTPEAPQGTTRTSGGILTLDAPEGMNRSPGGILTRDVDVSQGIEMRQRPSGLWVPTESLPPVAPRASILGADGNPLPSAAPRIVAPSGAPVSVPAAAPPLTSRVMSNPMDALSIGKGVIEITSPDGKIDKLNQALNPRPFQPPPPVQAPRY